MATMKPGRAPIMAVHEMMGWRASPRAQGEKRKHSLTLGLNATTCVRGKRSFREIMLDKEGQSPSALPLLIFAITLILSRLVHDLHVCGELPQ